MKVNNLGNNMAGVEIAKNRKAEEMLTTNKQKTIAEIDSSESAKVNLSSQAEAFQKAKGIASQDSVDEAKVARLQKLIDDGNYKVDAGAIADRLVDEHLLMDN